MKYKIFLCLFILNGFRAFSQSNTIGLAYSAAKTNVDIFGAIGDFGYHTKTGNTFGLSYTKKITRYLSLQTGLFYADDKAEETSSLPGRSGVNYDGDLKLISVPAIAKFTFFKYLYADAGMSFDKELNYTGNYLSLDQSGIGLETGLGAQYTTNHITVFVNPYIKIYSIARFNRNQDFSLVENGFKFGLGYSF
jgi:hypothetical protein